MNKITITLAFALTLAASSWVAHAESTRLQMVATVDGQGFPDWVVEDFLENNVLSDQLKSILFMQAQGDYDSYLIKKSEWMRTNLTAGAKSLAYSMIMYQEAVENGFERLFLITEEQFNQAVLELEEKTLSPAMTREQLAVEAARTRFGNELINNNYPHQRGASPDEVYRAWLESKKNQLKENFRKRGIKNWELFKGTKGREVDITEFEVSDFYKEAKEAIDSMTDGTRLTRKELDIALDKTPRVATLIKNIQLNDLGSVALYDVLTGNDQTSIQSVHTALKKILSGQTVDRILGYEKTAHDFAVKYQTEQQLSILSGEQFKQFESDSGDYRNYTLSLLYGISEKIIANAPDRDLERAKLRAALTRIFDQILMDLQNGESLFKDESAKKSPLKRILSDRIFSDLKSKLNISDKQDDYSARLTQLSSWIVAFESMKFAVDFKAAPVIEALPFNRESVKNIKQRIFTEKCAANFNDYINKDTFFEKSLRNRWEGRLAFNLPDGLSLTGSAAVDFVLGKK